MGRQKKAPELEWTSDGWRLRFTHDGRRHDFRNRSIPQGDRAAACAWRDDRLQFVYSGAWKQEKAEGSDPAAKLRDVAAIYLAEKTGGELTNDTAELYKAHLRKRFTRRWDKLSDITKAALASYQAERLKEVKLATIRKELNTLRQVLRFAEDRGWIPSLPPFPRRPKKATGTPHKFGASGYTKGFTAEHTAAILRKLPALSKATRDEGIRWPLRAFFAFQDATGQRPGLIEGLRYGIHWRKGDTTLKITADIDKNRWERTVPLSAAAVAALESVEPQPDGRMFRHLDFRHSLRKAAREAGVPEHIASRVHTYDLRHARTTAWVSGTGKISGVGFLVGHKQATTTNRYTHSDERQGLEVLELMAADSGDDSGDTSKRPDSGHCDAAQDLAVFGCAKGGTRTPMEVTPLAPQGGEVSGHVRISAGKRGAAGRQKAPRDADSGDSPHYSLGALALAEAARRLGVTARLGAA